MVHALGPLGLGGPFVQTILGEELGRSGCQALGVCYEALGFSDYVPPEAPLPNFSPAAAVHAA